MSEITQIKSIVATLDIPAETKSTLLGILDNASLSDEEKKAKFIEVMSVAREEADRAIETELKPIYDEADQEMAQAETEYKAELAAIEKEAEAVYNETATELQALPEEE